MRGRGALRIGGLLALGWMLGAVATVTGIAAVETAAAADDPCDLVDTDSVGRLLGSTGTTRSTTVGAIPACRIVIGELTLELLDAADVPGEFDAQRASHADEDVRSVDGYVDGAFFGWGVDDAFDLVARRGDSVVVARLRGATDDFDAADPTADAPDGDVAGTEVGTALWVLTTEAFAAGSDTATPTVDDLNGLWRTTDIAPCSPARDVGVRVSRFVDDGGELRATKVSGDSCLDNGGADFEGARQGGRGSGLSFASVASAAPNGTPYDLQVDSPTQVTLSGAAGSLQYTLVYQRLSWPGLALEERSVLLGIPSPSEAFTAKNVALTGAISGLLLLIVVLPTTMFNSALEANLDHYRAFAERLRRRLAPRARPGGGRSFWATWRGALVYVVAAGALFSLMDPGWGLNSVTVVSLLGFVGGVGVSSVLGVVAAAIYLQFRHGNARGHTMVEPGTLALASLFVLASRLVGFVPGYMYGVLVNWESDHRQQEEDRSTIIAFSSAITLVAALVSWLLIPAMRDVAGPDPGVIGSLPLSVVSGLFVGSVESLTIGLIPLRFLPGHTLRAHHAFAWKVLWFGGGVLFVLVLMRPGLVSGASRNVVGTIVLVTVSSLVAVGFWRYETRRARRAGGPGGSGPGLPPPVPPQYLPRR